MKSLYDYLSKLKDFRRAQGQRFPFAAMVEMIVLAALSGRFGINPLKRFIKNNSDYFIARYNLQHGAPSGTAMYTFLCQLNYGELNEVLRKWSSQYLELGPESWMAIDGKSLNSTGVNHQTEKQNFKKIVSLFCTEKQIVVTAQSYEDKKKGHEAQVAREIIEKLELKGITMTLDALHCKKKRSKPSWIQEMTL